MEQFFLFFSFFFFLAVILTGAQVGTYASKPQITAGYQTHIQVNPECKNIDVCLLLLLVSLLFQVSI
jgi:hypothetical protein